MKDNSKPQNFLRTLIMLVLVLTVGFLMVRCSDDDPKIVETEFYSVTGTVTYPNAEGTLVAASGAIVYLAESISQTTNYSWSAIADASGNYSITNLEAGDYFMFINYNNANQNLPGGRINGVNFDSGEGFLFTITDTDIQQNSALSSSGQAEAEAVNTTDAGSWSSDLSHSNVDFTFPYDAANANYTGRFNDFFIEVDFDPADLAGSSISASIDLLSVNTSSRGGRDSFFDAALDAWDYGCLQGTLGVSVDAVSLLPDELTRYATFESSSIEIYGDGYLATGNFTFNGTTNSETLFFKFVEGFTGTNRQGVPTQFSSFEGQLEFDALADYTIDSSHLGDETVTVDISYQVTTEL